MARPVGSKTRRKIVKPILGAQGSYCDMDELIEKIGEVVHEDAKVTALMLKEDGTTCCRIEGEAGYEMEAVDPIIYTNTVALLEAVIARVKGQ